MTCHNWIFKKSITSKQVESVIKNLLAKESPGPDGLSSEFYRGFRELKSSFLKLLQKVEAEGSSLNPFYEARIILLPKPDKDTSRKLQNNIPDEYWCKNPQKKKKNTVGPLYLWVPHPQIQSTIDWKYLKKKSGKVPKSKSWSCCTLATLYIAFTLYLGILSNLEII